MVTREAASVSQGLLVESRHKIAMSRMVVAHAVRDHLPQRHRWRERHQRHWAPEVPPRQRGAFPRSRRLQRGVRCPGWVRHWVPQQLGVPRCTVEGRRLGVDLLPWVRGRRWEPERRVEESAT